MAELSIVLVTPERTLFEKPIQSLRVPMFDGSAGIYPGRAPLVGRLGTGALNLTSADGPESYFIDGGFVQVKGTQVCVLTNAATPAAEVTTEVADEAMKTAREMPVSTDAEFEAASHALQKAREQQRIAVTGK